MNFNSTVSKDRKSDRDVSCSIGRKENGKQCRNANIVDWKFLFVCSYLVEVFIYRLCVPYIRSNNTIRQSFSDSKFLLKSRMNFALYAFIKKKLYGLLFINSTQAPLMLPSCLSSPLSPISSVGVKWLNLHHQSVHLLLLHAEVVQ